MNENTDGRKCPKCGEWKHWTEYHRNRSRETGYQDICKPCFNVANAASRAKRADYWREHYAERMRATYAEHGAERRAKTAEWYVKHGKDWHREWTDRNREQERERTKKWRAAHPYAMQVSGNNSRARRDHVEGIVTESEWLAILARHDHKCASCGKQSKLEIDHIVPMKLGGTNTSGNVQPLCHACNTRKRQDSTDYRK
jgi:5-methylcytosine-specific restriction endonuclease McrA